MPGTGITGTGAILGQSMLNARLAASGADQSQIPPAVYAAMLAMAQAEGAAIVAHIVTFGIATGLAPPGTAGGPITLGGIL